MFDALPGTATGQISLLIAAAIGGLVGWLIAYAAAQRRITALTIMLEHELETADDKAATVEQVFKTLSDAALLRNQQSFLALAGETFSRFQEKSNNELLLREKSVEDLIHPMRDALVRANRHLEQAERDRREAQGALSQHLRLVAESQQALHRETRNLVQALRRPEVRGRWGELTLRRLVELAGLTNHCDFTEQVSLTDGDAKLRPDMIIHLPAGRDVVIDAKTPLDAYLNATEAPDEATRHTQLQRHARNLRARVRELAGKAYWQQCPAGCDYVILFIPGDAFLSAALEQAPELLEQALAQRVMLATPTTLVALLRTIGQGWRHQRVADNAEQIRTLAEEFYTRLATFGAHLARLGRQLDAGIQQYNLAVGSFDAKLTPAARRFADLGVSTRKTMTPPEPVTTRPRQPAEPET